MGRSERAINANQKASGIMSFKPFGLSIKPFKLLGQAFKILAPVAVGAVASPAAGVLVATALGTGKAVKVAGHAIEERTGVRPHKVVGPVAVIGVPAALGHFVAPEAIDGLCALVTKACDGGSLAIVIPGVIAWLVYNFGRVLER